jgi:hypothetical protein
MTRFRWIRDEYPGLKLRKANVAASSVAAESQGLFSHTSVLSVSLADVAAVLSDVSSIGVRSLLCGAI